MTVSCPTRAAPRRRSSLSAGTNHSPVALTPCFVSLGWWMLSLFLPFAVGCETGQPTQTSDDQRAVDESREGYGHDRPPHKPDDLQNAVVEIERRWEALEERSTADAKRSPPNAPDRRVSELEDILIWLPELAAETDLRRAEWERVNSLSRELLQFLKPYLSSTERNAATSNLASSLSDGTTSSGWRESWNALREIAAMLPSTQEPGEVLP
jgi:hypothetical protein